jgi:hypothetical protein
MFTKRLGKFFFIENDHDTELRYLLRDYILEHFDLHELYIVFFCQGCYKFSPGIIKESRQGAIDDINDNKSFTTDEAKRLKRKVWDMNPIIYGLIHEFIHHSGLFGNEEDGLVFPTSF